MASIIHKRVILFLSLPFLLVSSFAVEENDSAFNFNFNFKFNNRKISTFHSSSSSSSKTAFVVIFDAGSTGSRVHVFNFDQDLNLLFMGTNIEVYSEIKPGLSAYANDPKEAADSLTPLLEKAQSAVPQEFHSVTPVRVGATAGLRLLEGDKSDKILEAVTNLLKTKSNFKYEVDEVSVIGGIQEGSYLWLTINYLLENLGKKYEKTVGVIDLGGGSLQMAYGISDEEAAKAPSNGDTKYIQNLDLNGAKYNLYVHSYLHYGLQASRGEILKVTKDLGNPCVLAGYQGIYTYGGEEYKASAPGAGPSFDRCREVILEALKITKTCTFNQCSFDGIWNGGGGDGLKNIYAASSFYYKAEQVGLIDSKKPEGIVKAIDYKKEAIRACNTKFEEAESTYPNVHKSDLAYVCMDLVYEYTVLVDGFRIHPQKEITLVKNVPYHGSLAEAAWPLGNAIAVVSSSKILVDDH